MGRSSTVRWVSNAVEQSSTGRWLSTAADPVRNATGNVAEPSVFVSGSFTLDRGRKKSQTPTYVMFRAHLGHERFPSTVRFPSTLGTGVFRVPWILPSTVRFPSTLGTNVFRVPWILPSTVRFPSTLGTDVFRAPCVRRGCRRSSRGSMTGGRWRRVGAAGARDGRTTPERHWGRFPA